LKESMNAYGDATNINLTKIAENLQSAVDHTVDFKQAAQTTTLATAAGFNSEQIIKMGEAAKMAALALGRDMGDALDRLTRGVVKAEPEVLDELGIILRLEPATKKYAEMIGKTVRELTTFEKSQAVLNEVLTQTERKFGSVGDSVAANPYGKLQAQVTEMALELGGLLNAVVNPLIEGILRVPQLLVVAFAGLLTFLGKSVFAGAFSKIMAKGKDAGMDLTDRSAAAERNVIRAKRRAKISKARLRGDKFYDVERRASVIRDENGVAKLDSKGRVRYKARSTRYDLQDRDPQGRYIKRSSGRQRELWGASKRDQWGEFKARAGQFGADSAGDLSDSKSKFDRNRKMGSGVFKSFNDARKRMTKGMNISFKEAFGKGGKTSKSLLFFQKMMKTSTLAMYAFGAAAKTIALAVVGAIMILPALVQMFSSIGKGMGLVTVSTTEYSDATNSLTDAISKQEAELSRVGNAYELFSSADYFQQMIKSSELFANSLSNTDEALNSNINILDKFLAQGTKTSKAWSAFLGMFGQSVFDDSVTSLNLAIVSSERLGMNLEELGITQEQVNNATSKWHGDERQTLALLRKIKKPMEDRTRSARNYANALKEIKQAGIDVGKEWKKLATNLPTTPIDSLLENVTRLSTGLRTAKKEVINQFKDWDISTKLEDVFATKDNKYINNNPDSNFQTDPVRGAMDALEGLKGIITPNNKEEVLGRIKELYDKFYAEEVPRIKERAYNAYKKKLAVEGGIPLFDDVVATIKIIPVVTGIYDAPGTDKLIQKKFAKYLSNIYLTKHSIEQTAVQAALEPYIELEKTLQEISKLEGITGLKEIGDFGLEAASTWEAASKSVELMAVYAHAVQAAFILAKLAAQDLSRNASVIGTGLSSSNLEKSLIKENQAIAKRVAILDMEIRLNEGTISTMKDEVKKAQAMLKNDILRNKQAVEKTKLAGEEAILFRKMNSSLKEKIDLETQSLSIQRSLIEAKAALGSISQQSLNTGTANNKSTTQELDYMSKVMIEGERFIKFQDKINASTLKDGEEKRSIIDAESILSAKRLKAYTKENEVKHEILSIELKTAELADRRSKIEDIVSHASDLRDIYKDMYDFESLHTASQKTAFDLTQRLLKLKLEETSINKQISLSTKVGATHNKKALENQKELNILRQAQITLEESYLKAYIDLNAMRSGELTNAEKKLEILEKEFDLFKTLSSFHKKDNQQETVYNNKFLATHQKILNVEDELRKVGDDKNTQIELQLELNGLLLDQDLLKIENHSRILDNLKEQHEVQKRTLEDRVVSGEELRNTFGNEMHYRLEEFNDNFRDNITFAADLWGAAFLDPLDRMAENLKNDKGLYGEKGWDEFWNNTWRGIGDQLIDQGTAQMKKAMMSPFEKDKLAEAARMAEEQEKRAIRDSDNLQSTASLLSDIKYNTDPGNKKYSDEINNFSIDMKPAADIMFSAAKEFHMAVKLFPDNMRKAIQTLFPDWLGDSNTQLLSDEVRNKTPKQLGRSYGAGEGYQYKIPEQWSSVASQNDNLDTLMFQAEFEHEQMEAKNAIEKFIDNLGFSWIKEVTDEASDSVDNLVEKLQTTAVPINTNPYLGMDTNTLPWQEEENQALKLWKNDFEEVEQQRRNLEAIRKEKVLAETINSLTKARLIAEQAITKEITKRINLDSAVTINTNPYLGMDSDNLDWREEEKQYLNRWPKESGAVQENRDYRRNQRFINGLASGGHISGPGGPTEDKIPAWLSNGEYVINAASTKKHESLIEAINQDKVPAFAHGGKLSEPHKKNKTFEAFGSTEEQDAKISSLLKEHNKSTDLQLPGQPMEEWSDKVLKNWEEWLEPTAFAHGGKLSEPHINNSLVGSAAIGTGLMMQDIGGGVRQPKSVAKTKVADHSKALKAINSGRFSGGITFEHYMEPGGTSGTLTGFKDGEKAGAIRYILNKPGGHKMFLSMDSGKGVYSPHYFKELFKHQPQITEVDGGEYTPASKRASDAYKKILAERGITLTPAINESTHLQRAIDKTKTFLKSNAGKVLKTGGVAGTGYLLYDKISDAISRAYDFVTGAEGYAMGGSVPGLGLFGQGFGGMGGSGGGRSIMGGSGGGRGSQYIPKFPTGNITYPKYGGNMTKAEWSTLRAKINKEHTVEGGFNQVNNSLAKTAMWKELKIAGGGFKPPVIPKMSIKAKFNQDKLNMSDRAFQKYYGFSKDGDGFAQGGPVWDYSKPLGQQNNNKKSGTWTGNKGNKLFTDRISGKKIWVSSADELPKGRFDWQLGKHKRKNMTKSIFSKLTDAPSHVSKNLKQTNLFGSGQGFDSKWLKGTGYQAPLPGIDSKNVYTDKWKKQFIKDLATHGRGPSQLSLFPQNRLPFSGTGIPTNSKVSVASKAARFGKSFLKWGAGPVGIGISISELIDWYMEEDESNKSIMDNVIDLGKTHGVNAITREKFSEGGKLQDPRNKGRNGDTLLAHINKDEADLLKKLGGAGTANPTTGLPEFYGADSTLQEIEQEVSLKDMTGFFDSLGLEVVKIRDEAKTLAQISTNTFNKLFDVNGEMIGAGNAQIARASGKAVKAADELKTDAQRKYDARFATFSQLIALNEDGKISDEERKSLSSYQCKLLEQIEAALGGKGKLSATLNNLDGASKKEALLRSGAQEAGATKEEADAYINSLKKVNGDFISQQDSSALKASEQQYRTFKINNSEMGKVFSEFGVQLSDVHGMAAGAFKNALGEAFRTGKFDAKSMLSQLAFGVGQMFMNNAVDSLFAMMFAKGGIAEGGFRAFASGGTVTSPTLGLVGEGKYNEAIVPLPDGKSIPVIGNTGGGGETTNNVSVSINMADGTAQSTVSGGDGAGSAEDMSVLGDMIAGQVQQLLMDEKRPGGLLSDI
jgi:hypothetical protein